jgi:hypothetical protein
MNISTKASRATRSPLWAADTKSRSLTGTPSLIVNGERMLSTGHGPFMGDSTHLSNLLLL